MAGGPVGGPIPSGPSACLRPTPPHSLALAAAPALTPAGWRSWQVQTLSPQLPGRPTPSRRRLGVDRAPPSLPSAPDAAPRPPPATPRARAASRTPEDAPGAPGGAGAVRSGAGRRGHPPRHGLASGRRRQLRVPSGLGVGCAGVSSLWPAAGWWREWGTAESAGRGRSALGHGRTRKPGARDWGNCCGAALAFL